MVAMKSLSISLLILTLIFGLCDSGYATTSSSSSNCPSSANAPLCPNSGATVLDESYPAQAYVVSTRGMASDNDTNYASSFISNIVDGHLNREMPLFFVPTEKSESVEKIRSNVKKQLLEKLVVGKRLDANALLRVTGRVEQILANIQFVPATGYTWQQDYFESMFDPKTGNAQMREVLTYRSRLGAIGTDTIKGIGANNQCQIKVGDGLPPNDEALKRIKEKNSNDAPLYGGNIEATPGGFCVVGDNMDYKDYAEHFCGKEENVIAIDVDWLVVGHSDEVYKVIPDKSGGKCGFNIMLASPRKALELMKDDQHQPFLNFDHYGSDQMVIEKARRDRFLISLDNGRDYDVSAGMRLCQLYHGISKQKKMDKEKGKSSTTVKSALLNLLSFDAYAGLVIKMSTKDQKEDIAEPKDCSSDSDYRNEVSKMTNGDFLNGYQQDSELKKYNELVQKKMDAARKELETRIFGRMPECRGKVDFIEVPNIFYPEAESGLNISTGDDGNELYDLKKGLGSSFLPNPTNGVLAGDKMIFSNPQNATFEKYLEKEMKSRTGLKTGLVDSWNYAHVGNGNVHCSTHALRFCKPRE